MKKLLNILLAATVGCNGCSTRPLQQVKIEPEDYKIQYDGLTVNNIINIYHGRKKELPICQLGTRVGNTFRVTDIKLPRILNVTDSMTRYDPSVCRDDKRYLGMLHNHNDGNCNPSLVDAYRFVHDDPAKIESILCELKYEEGTMRVNTIFKERIAKTTIDSIKSMGIILPN